MKIREKNFSEKSFQENFVRRLEKYKWSAPDELDGNKTKVTVDILIKNWREELNRLNADILEGVELSDNEFSQVMAKVNNIPNSYEAAKLLTIEQGKGKIDGIIRDKNENVTRNQITLTIFKREEVSGGDTSYKIAREVETKAGNRFDIVLLINGLPLINIEQKRTDKTLDEAFYQFRRYYEAGEYTHNFMAFSQMMVINSEIDTQYFATPKSVQDFNKSFVFRWAYGDKDGHKSNKPITDWEDIVSKFLMIPMAHQMIGDYVVIDEAENPENRRHMLMRPYQVYALREVEKAALGTDGTRIPHGGFVWHTTGSGKTITSFKTALFLLKRGDFDKIIFLVDRKDLDDQTSSRFKAYAAYDNITVDDTEYTYELKNRLKEKSGLVVTTTYKLSALVKDLKENQDNSFKDKKIVFIIDEAHRTTMGDMLVNIKSYFRENGLFFGFTGTPLFEENNAKGKINENNLLINTTEKLFGPRLHKYTIDQAIADGNVLGFHVDYINTGEFSSYEELREKLIEKKLKENPQLDSKKVEREIQKLDELSIEKLAKEQKILNYYDEVHIPKVVEEILENWEGQSQERKFNAILTVKSKRRVIEYYREFKKQKKEKNININVVATFSSELDNSEEKSSENKIIKELLEDYSEFSGAKFKPDNQGFASYFEHLKDLATCGGSGRNEKYIDLIIVAEQLLTGYDNKRLNTLYVDRTLELQSLVQAYSRTNRVFGSDEEFGTIVNFMYPRITEENVNAALELYGSGGRNSNVIFPKYEDSVEELREKVLVLKTQFQNPEYWKEIEQDEDKKEEFKQAFIDVSRQLNLVQQYYEYSWDDEQFGFDEHSYMKYKGAYKNLFPSKEDRDKITIIIPKLGKTKLVGVQEITAEYILKLIGDKKKEKDRVDVLSEESYSNIYKVIEEFSNLGEKNKADLLREFVDELRNDDSLSGEENIAYIYEDWKTSKQKYIIREFSESYSVDNEILWNSYLKYNSGDIPYLGDIRNSSDYDKAKIKLGASKLTHNMKLTKKLSEFMEELSEKFRR